MFSHFSDTFKDLLKWPAMYDLFDRIFGEENDPLQGVDLKSEIAKTVKAAVKVTEDDLPAFFAENFQVLFVFFIIHKVDAHLLICSGNGKVINAKKIVLCVRVLI